MLNSVDTGTQSEQPHLSSFPWTYYEWRHYIASPPFQTHIQSGGEGGVECLWSSDKITLWSAWEWEKWRCAPIGKHGNCFYLPPGQGLWWDSLDFLWYNGLHPEGPPFFSLYPGGSKYPMYGVHHFWAGHVPMIMPSNPTWLLATTQNCPTLQLVVKPFFMWLLNYGFCLSFQHFWVALTSSLHVTIAHFLYLVKRVWSIN